MRKSRVTHFNLANTPWNDDNTLYAKNRWEQGASAYIIAEELRYKGYKITRNAVIGKMHRMNIKQPKRANSPKPPREQPRKRILFAPADPRSVAISGAKKKTKLPTIIQTKILDPNNPGISIMELGPDTCRAIVRDGTATTLATYCGEPVAAGKAYCEPHCQLYFDPPRARWRV